MAKKMALICCMVLPFIQGFSKGKSSLIETRREQLRNVHERLKAAQKRLHEANLRERDVSRQLNDAQNNLHLATDNLNRYSTELRRTELNLNFTKRRLASSEEQYGNQQALLSDRLSGIYRNGKVPLLEFLLGAKSFSSFLNRYYALRLIMDQDLKLTREIKQQKEEIAHQKDLLNQEYDQVHGLREKVQVQYQEFANITTAREGLLGQVRQERQVYQQHVTELEEISAQLERELEELIRREQARLRASHHVFTHVGAFLWPVGSHMITSPFGWRVHPIFGGNRFHTGVDIGADTGSAIMAAADGVVIYSGWYGGYGQAVVIDHGNGLSTVYAHCSALYVHQGETVRRGDRIAAVGSTGNANGPHLHFEVRENGTAVDPMGKF